MQAYLCNMHIDHTTLRTRHLEETKAFLLEVFDLTEGPRPERIASGIEGYWLYHKNAPIIHLIQSYDKPGLDRSSEAIDHTAFFLEDYETFLQKLLDLKIRYSSMDLPEIGERRIFIKTPTGILLETVFRKNNPS